MFTLPWWYLFFTLTAILYGLFASPIGFYAAIALCLVQAIHFGIEDKHVLSFSCQVRYAMALMFAVGLWEPARWIYWIPVAGLTARLTVNYCLMARLMSLLPWNLKQPCTREIVKRTIFSPPTRGCIQIKET